MWQLLFFLCLGLLLFFMIDQLTFLWVRRVYYLAYSLMIWGKGYVIFIDIDNFKQFNDEHGYETGDKVLRRVGVILLTETRLRAFRWGGEELCILLPWSNKEKAMQLAERIRRKVQEASIGGLQVTISCGVAKYEEDARRLLQRAKSNGKNQVLISE
jgi:diguanylate cyclase (GGDEF)-like protein